MWSDRLAAFALVLILGIGGCTVEPLYGSASMGGEPLGRVAVEEVNTRVAQRVREQLIRDLGRPAPGAATLTIEVDNRIELFLTNFETERASAGTATVTVDFKLIGVDGATIAEGQERARASFDAPLQEFARQRAIRDAEDRAAREAAQRLRLTIAPAIAGLAPLASPGVDLSVGPERDPESI